MQIFNTEEIVRIKYIGVYDADDHRLSEFLKSVRVKVAQQKLIEINKCIFVGDLNAHFDGERSVIDNIFAASFLINNPYRLVKKTLGNIIIESRLTGRELVKLNDLEAWQVMLLGLNLYFLEENRYFILDQFRQIGNPKLQQLYFDKMIDVIKKSQGCIVGSRDLELLNKVCDQVYCIDSNWSY